MSQRVTIFGTGHWGLTLALVAALSGSHVMLYVRRSSVWDMLETYRTRPDLLPDMSLPETVTWTCDLAKAAGYASSWILAWPSQHLRELAKELGPYLYPGNIAISASKGLERQSQLRMSEVLTDVWGRHAGTVGALSGPNLADDISHRRPAATVVALPESAWPTIRQQFGQAHLRLYHQRDLVGVELGGALKNVLAIAVGICHGAGLGASADAAVTTRGLHEMARLAVAMGAKPETLAGLSGLGDVVVTASSDKSRNRRLGVMLGQGRALRDILGETQEVVEGVETAYVALSLGQAYRLEMPITEEVVRVLEGKSVSDAVESLMTRSLRPETH